MEGTNLESARKPISMASEREFKAIPVTVDRSHPDISGDGPWVFISNKSKRIKVAVGRLKPKFTPLGVPLLGAIVWAQFKNFRFVTKDKIVAVELRHSNHYDVAFSLMTPGMEDQAITPLEAGNERVKCEVDASRIAMPMKAVDELDEPKSKPFTPPDKDTIVKGKSQETIRRG